MGESEIDAEPPEIAGARSALPTGAIRVAMPMTSEALGAADFGRADLIFSGVRHDASSYEVRVFLNNAEATERTARDAANGYAGKFFVFGHGGCFGAAGHCAPQVAPGAPIPALAGVQRPDPLAPQEKIITITEPLRRLMAEGEGLRSLTLVPILSGARASEDRISAEAFGFDRVRLETYQTEGGASG